MTSQIGQQLALGADRHYLGCQSLHFSPIMADIKDWQLQFIADSLYDRHDLGAPWGVKRR